MAAGSLARLAARDHLVAPIGLLATDRAAASNETEKISRMHAQRTSTLRRARRIALLAATLSPAALRAQTSEERWPELTVGGGFSHQGAHGAPVGESIGGHLQLGVGRWRLRPVGVRGDLDVHRFIGTGCDAGCGRSGADWIASAGPTLVVHARGTRVPAYALLGAAADHGGDEGSPRRLRAGGSVGAGLTLVRGRRATLAVEGRYHRLTERIAGSTYLAPLTLALTW